MNPVPAKMNLGDLMDAAGKLYTENASLLLSVYGIALVIQAILSFIAHGAGLLGTLVGMVGTAALINAIAARIQRLPIDVGQAYSSLSVSTYIFFIVATILYGLAVVIGLILVIIPGIYLMVRFLFVQQAIVVDRTGIFEAFSRSSELVSGNWWRIFAYGLVLFILYAVIEGIASAFGGVGGIVALVVQFLAFPFIYAVLTALYFNLRALKGEPVTQQTYA